MSSPVQLDKLYTASFEAFFLSQKEEEKSKYAPNYTVELRSFNDYSLEGALDILMNIPKKVYGHPLDSESIRNFKLNEYSLVHKEVPAHLMSGSSFGSCDVVRKDGDETLVYIRNSTEKLTKIDKAIVLLREKINALK